MQIFLLFLAGFISGLAFAPIFFAPSLFLITILYVKIRSAKTQMSAFYLGSIFGFGHFLSSMYWISIGVSVYQEFWWAIPFALCGIPMILAVFIGFTAYLSWHFRIHAHVYKFAFCISWIFCEWLRSWLFTGLPWNLLGTSLTFSEIFVQSVSIIGVYGQSFLILYVVITLYEAIFIKSYKNLPSIIIALSMLISVYYYGKIRLENNPTKFSEVKVRVVQPSIKQEDKWEPETFWINLERHISLSEQNNAIDLIIWPEAAMTSTVDIPEVKNRILQMLSKENAILITGAVSDNNLFGDDLKIYSSLIALSKDGSTAFEYNKSHLVPFGEYMPLKNILPMKKLTPGIIDYSQGNSELVYLKAHQLWIRPLICYEAIFQNEARTSNKIADLIINVSNDAWYGKSSGPYQHFEISRLRAIENGLPMIRVSNNGISGIIDPLGRVIAKLDLDQIGFLDSKIPNKLATETVYSILGDYCSLFFCLSIIIIQYLMTACFSSVIFLRINNIVR